MPRRAAFLDRDGTIIADLGHNWVPVPDNVRILPGVPSALARLKRHGYLLVLASNQSAVARGLCSEEEVRAFNAEMVRLLVASGAPPLDALYFCPHHPEGSVPAHAIACTCRKPAPGLLERAAADLDLDLACSVMIGDRERDLEAGRAAGCSRVLKVSGSADPTVHPNFESVVRELCAGLARGRGP